MLYYTILQFTLLYTILYILFAVSGTGLPPNHLLLVEGLRQPGLQDGKHMIRQGGREAGRPAGREAGRQGGREAGGQAEACHVG